MATTNKTPYGLSFPALHRYSSCLLWFYHLFIYQTSARPKNSAPAFCKTSHHQYISVAYLMPRPRDTVRQTVYIVFMISV
ncbi:hypothetical protein C8F04DRAFT_179530 [Mycena alexandri]|uniref:Uncharacterized protein n=1 Tax=Mycena alexandri TaxID=1745969 RepID=A0AAD6SA94_9AGAR|nr:hypothetical protein C8F04DRAFT_179530 [Mycena alexandri]